MKTQKIFSLFHARYKTKKILLYFSKNIFDRDAD